MMLLVVQAALGKHRAEKPNRQALAADCGLRQVRRDLSRNGPHDPVGAVLQDGARSLSEACAHALAGPVGGGLRARLEADGAERDPEAFHGLLSQAA